MESVKSFLTMWEAIDYCDKLTNFGNKANNLRIEKELDGRFHVYDADAIARGFYEETQAMEEFLSSSSK
jgi:hypothetical protein